MRNHYISILFTCAALSLGACANPTTITTDAQNIVTNAQTITTTGTTLAVDVVNALISLTSPITTVISMVAKL